MAGGHQEGACLSPRQQQAPLALPEAEHLLRPLPPSVDFVTPPVCWPQLPCSSPHPPLCPKGPTLPAQLPEVPHQAWSSPSGSTTREMREVLHVATEGDSEGHVSRALQGLTISSVSIQTQV